MHDISSTLPKHPKILIVDDDPDSIDIVATKLTMAGFKIVTTEMPEDALHLAANERPHAILLDVIMPRVSGQDVLLQLKADERTKDIPVIMLSVVNASADIDAAMRHGAVCYFVKAELTPQQILEELERCMKK
jgi:PleD family two-component response regulator